MQQRTGVPELHATPPREGFPRSPRGRNLHASGSDNNPPPETHRAHNSPHNNTLQTKTARNFPRHKAQFPSRRSIGMGAVPRKFGTLTVVTPQHRFSPEASNQSTSDSRGKAWGTAPPKFGPLVFVIPQHSFHRNASTQCISDAKETT